MGRVNDLFARTEMVDRRTASAVAERHHAGGGRACGKRCGRQLAGMVSRCFSRLGLLLAGFWLAACLQGSRAAEYPALGLDVFEPGADAERQIDAAVEKATAEGKRIVLVFGANWSPWCRRLNDAFESDPALIERMRKDFVLVKIDVNRRKDPQMNRFTDGRLGMPTRLGLPALVLLDAKGEKLAEQDSGDLETADGSRYEREKLLALFAGWVALR